MIRRWNHSVKCLSQRGITVLGISSDGDSRLMKAMHIKSGIGIQNPDWSMLEQDFALAEFYAYLLPEFICTQDTVHIGTKLKTRFLKPSLIMPLGNFFISSGHLSILIDNVSKDKHMLSACDISSKDKMNFASMIKICDPRIWHLLRSSSQAVRVPLLTFK